MLNRLSTMHKNHNHKFRSVRDPELSLMALLYKAHDNTEPYWPAVKCFGYANPNIIDPKTGMPKIRKGVRDDVQLKMPGEKEAKAKFSSLITDYKRKGYTKRSSFNNHLRRTCSKEIYGFIKVHCHFLTRPSSHPVENVSRC